MKQTGHWYVATARPQMDVRAAKDLIIRGITTIVPVDYEKIRMGKRWSVQPVLWLSPYVFVLVETSEHFDAILGTLGIEGFVSLGRDEHGSKAPTRVPQKLIDHLMEDQVANLDEATRRVRARDSAFREGERVQVIAGPFESRTGVVKRCAHGHVWIEQMMPFPARVAESDVVSLEPSPAKAAA